MIYSVKKFRMFRHCSDFSDSIQSMFRICSEFSVNVQNVQNLFRIFSQCSECSDPFRMFRLVRQCSDSVQSMFRMFRMFSQCSECSESLQNFSEFLAQQLVYSELLDCVVQCLLEFMSKCNVKQSHVHLHSYLFLLIKHVKIRS